MIGDCYCRGDGGGSAVGAALAAQTSLTCLNLETNSLGDFAGAI